MALGRGVLTTRGSSASKPIKMSSVLPVALVLTALGVAEDIYSFDSPAKALAFFKSKNATGGNWERYLDLWENRFPTTVKTIISVAEFDEDEAVLKGNVIEAVNRLLGTQARFDTRIDIVAVPDFAKDINVLNSINTVCQKFKARSFIDIDTDNSSTASLFRTQIGSDRISLINSPLGTFNTDTNANEWYDGGVCMAFMRAYMDGAKELGWWDSISNKPINMDDIKHKVQYNAGADETDIYSDKQIWCWIKDSGIRAWGSDFTCSADPIWQHGGRVRLVDLMVESIQTALKDSIDKDLGELSVVKNSLSSFKNTLIGQGILIGGNIELDTEATTNTEITAGNFHFIFDFQDAPKVRKVVINLNYTDRYSSAVYDLVKG